jgi:hypothetical protein
VKRNPGCCIVPRDPPRRPDLATYSQDEQAALGSAPTWNSPDLTTNQDIPWTLLPVIQIVVRNLSPNASAINALVNVSTSTFGIGLAKTPLAAQKVNLAAGQQLALSFPLTAAILGGDQSIATFVDIEHPSDHRPINNHGSQVVRGVMASIVGRNAALPFPVLNSTGIPRTITLSVLANALGATVTPTSHAFAPWEQIVATLHVSVPAGTHGSAGNPIRNEISVAAHAGSLIGGATWIYWIDN